MDITPPYDDILDDANLAPLKRNHACLQCKKRKVKCDAIRPTCSPCLRSHAHALRSAQRSKTRPPPLLCTFADVDSPDDSSSPPEEVVFDTRRTSLSGPSETKGGHGTVGANGDKKKAAGKKSIVGIEREKERRREEDTETLLARIAELESRLAGLTPTDSNGRSSSGQMNPGDLLGQPWLSGEPAFDVSQAIPTTSVNGASGPMLQNLDGETADNPMAGMGTEFDFGDLFLVPANWPKNLPSPFLLEHLIETFFTHTPQISRMIHRPSLLSRLRLPPTNSNFPHASLLHAICAAASSYTAWVNSLAPELLEAAMERQKASDLDMENLEDFGVAQAEAGQRALRQSTQSCLFGPGNVMFEITQATVLLSDFYYVKGMPLQAFMIGGHPSRLMKAMELHNKNVPKRYKEPLIPEPRDAIEREERLATVWMTFVLDAGFAMNSFWSQSMDLAEVRCNLPTSAEEYRKKNELMMPNPQNAESPDLFTNHPVADSFVLVVKASIILSRSAKWLREWQQRDIVPGDDQYGFNTPAFNRIVNDVYEFQSSIPGAMKNVFKCFDQPNSSPFDPSLLLVHVLPNIALCLMHEPFVDWHEQSSPSLSHIERAYQTIIGVLHLIPSNLDVSLVVTSVFAFSLYTIGRIIASFVQRALNMQQLGLAVRYRADMSTIQSILDRYGQNHTMGQLLSTFLEKYLKVDGATVLSCADSNVREMKSITYATVSDLTNLEMAFDIPLTGNGILDHSSISPPQHGGSSGRATRSESKKTTPDSGGSLLDHTKSAGEMTIPRDYSMWT